MLGCRVLASFALAAPSAPRRNADTPTGKLVLVGRALDTGVILTHRDAPTGRLTLIGGGGAVSQPIVRPGVMQIPGWPRTAMPGTPGLVQPGYFFTGSAAVWHGPWPMQMALGDPNADNATHQVGATLTVAPTVASQLSAAGVDYWEFH